MPNIDRGFGQSSGKEELPAASRMLLRGHMEAERQERERDINSYLSRAAGKESWAARLRPDAAEGVARAKSLERKAQGYRAEAAELEGAGGPGR